MIRFLRLSNWFYIVMLVSLMTRAAEFERISHTERETVMASMQKLGLEIDPKPEGKRIGRFYIETKNPFPYDKGIFKYLRWLHTKTKDSYLTGQLLMEPGDLFSQNVITETEIRLSNMKVRSMTLIFPVQTVGHVSQDTVDLLIVTRDVVSFRSIFDITWVGNSLFQLTIGGTEASIAGTNKLASLTFQLRPFVMELAAFYIDPDFFSTRHQLSAAQSVILKRFDGSYEGVRGQLRFDKILYSEEQKWGYGFHVDYAYEPIFKLDGMNIRVFEPKNSAQRTEWKYRYLDIDSNVSVTRSYGGAVKNNFTAGYGIGVKRPFLFEDFSLSGDAAEQFSQEVLPIREFQSYLQLSYQYFWNDFFAMYDYDTFELQEWQRLGPVLSASTQVALRAIGSTYNFFRPSLSASYTTSFGHSSLLHVGAEVESRVEGQLLNNYVYGNALVVSPLILGVGRFVADAVFKAWYKDLNKHQLSLGGDSGLRGAPLSAYVGNNFLRSNIEFRTRSVKFGVFRLGAVAFYDVGSAFESRDQFNPTHDLGLGVRVLFAPFSRALWRFDVAVPVAGPRSGWQNFQLTFGIGQAF